MAMFVSEYLKSYRKTVEGAVFSGVANAKAYVEGWTSQVASDIPVVVGQDPEILDPILSPYAATFATFKARVFEAAQSQEKRAMALRIIVIAMMVFTSWRTFKNLQTQKALLEERKKELKQQTEVVVEDRAQKKSGRQRKTQKK